MVFLYKVLLYSHIFSVILSIGPYFVLFPMLKKMKTITFDSLPIYLDSFRFVVRLTKHAGHILVTTGVLLTWIGGYSWLTPWIVATIVIMVTSLYFIARAFSPLLNQLGQPHQLRVKLLTKLNRSLFIYLIVTMIMLWFMVAKPTFWW